MSLPSSVHDAEACDTVPLRRLIDVDGDDTDSDALLRHLEKCPRCQRAMDQLAADAPWWNDVQLGLRGSTSDALSYVDDSQSEEPGDERDDGWNMSALARTILDRSDNPAMIGRLGEFEILEPIGVGGMGIVLKGYDHELNRFVAVKVLHPHCATSAAARRRFVREAQAAAAVVHPHVIAIHAVDAQHHPPYLVMPFVPGESLQQRLTRTGVTEVIDALRIGQQIAEGLAAAHAQGLVHRDIKPANILLERNVERVVITDFGLARAADDASLTRSGVIAGTPQYMSPEQARGESVDARTDLFSLGSLLYAMLTGHSPFRAESSLSVLRRVCEDRPCPLREIRAEVPDWLQVFVDRLLAKSPDQRPQSARQVADLLQACVAHVQHPTQFPLPSDLIRWQANSGAARFASRRRRAMVGVLFSVFLVMVVGGTWRFAEQSGPHGPAKSEPNHVPRGLPSRSAVSGGEASQESLEPTRPRLPPADHAAEILELELAKVRRRVAELEHQVMHKE